MNKINRVTKFLSLITVSSLTLAACADNNSSDEFPNDDIRLIVPFSAGGALDRAARAIAPHFEDELGVNVVVENIPGATGALGQQEMMSSDPDGHTLILHGPAALTIVPNAEDVDYTLDDVSLAGVVVEFPYVWSVNSSTENDTGEALFQAATDSEVRVGVAGAQSQAVIEINRMNDDFDTNLVPVPFESNSEANTALLGNNVDATFLVASEDVLTYFDSGDFLPVAVGVEERVDFLEDTPTVEELGYDGINMATSYNSLGLHTDTPEEYLSVYETALESALEDSEVREQIGDELIPNDFIDGDANRELLESLDETYRPFFTD